MEFNIPAHPGELGLLKTLRRWIRGETTEPWIHKASIYGEDPISLTARYPPAIAENGERVWYFFCTPQKKQGNDARISRIAGEGTWKSERTFPVEAFNADLRVLVQVGSKQTFSYIVKKKSKSESDLRLGWIQHSFLLLQSEDPEGRCLCRVFLTKRRSKNPLIPQLAILAPVPPARAVETSASPQTSTAAVPGGGGGTAPSAPPTAVPGGGGATAPSAPQAATPSPPPAAATSARPAPAAARPPAAAAAAATTTATPSLPPATAATPAAAPPAATTTATTSSSAPPEAAEVTAAATPAPPAAAPPAAPAAAAAPPEAAPPSPAEAAAATTATARTSLPKRWVRVLISGSPTKMKDLSSAKRVYSMAEEEEEEGVAPPHKMVKLFDCKGWLTIDPAK